MMRHPRVLRAEAQLRRNVAVHFRPCGCAWRDQIEVACFGNIDELDRGFPLVAHLNLDVARTVLVGHSAGGHLALWAAARDYLPAGSQLHRAAPFIPAAVVSLAGIGDLKAYAPLVRCFAGPESLST